MTASDDARRRVVRDLHDGAQQRLVHAIVTLKLAQRALRQNDGEAVPLIDEALEQAEQGNAELRELAHGILPTTLARGGLRAGVGAFVARLDLPVEVDLAVDRFPAETEASAYFIVAESLTNVVKHSQAQRAEVRVYVEDDLLHVEIRDDGIGGADPGGHGLVGISRPGDRARRTPRDRESGRRRHAVGRHAAALSGLASRATGSCIDSQLARRHVIDAGEQLLVERRLDAADRVDQAIRGRGQTGVDRRLLKDVRVA